MMKNILALLAIMVLSSCNEHFEVEELYGYYAPLGYKNNFDTIQLKPDSVYHRKVYDKNHKLVLEMNGSWKLINQNSQIEIEPFYLNLDDDLVKFPSNVKDTSMVVVTTLETHNGVIGFCVGYFVDLDTNCYRKVK